MAVYTVKLRIATVASLLHSAMLQVECLELYTPKEVKVRVRNIRRKKCQYYTLNLSIFIGDYPLLNIS